MSKSNSIQQQKILVSVVGCNSYNQQEIDSAITQALEQINFKPKPKSKILIKPNLLSNNTPDQHSITHFTFIDFLCRYFQKYNCDVTIGESSAFYMKEGYTMEAFLSSKTSAIAQKYNIPLIAFENESVRSIPKSKLKFLDELYLPKIIDTFDLIVNVPKLKTHSLMRFTGALKNLFGLVPGGYKQILHYKTKNINEMAEIFLDLYENIKPKTLNVMDGVIGLDGGPSAMGKPKKLGYILASENPTALDVIACQIINYSPSDIPTITMAEKRNLMNLNQIKQIGNFNKIEFKKIQKGPIVDSEPGSILLKEVQAFPKISSKCNLCKKCIPHCPTKCFSIINNKLIFDNSKCIHCYTCVPVCPENAIGLETSFTYKILSIIRRIVNL